MCVTAESMSMMIWIHPAAVTHKACLDILHDLTVYTAISADPDLHVSHLPSQPWMLTSTVAGPGSNANSQVSPTIGSEDIGS